MHVPVLLRETIEGLALREGATAVDATMGAGGHTEAVSHALAPSGPLVGIDLDRDALAAAKVRLAGASCRIELIEGNFRDMEKLCAGRGIKTVDAVFFDLGLSSMQLEPPTGASGRGFSFRRNEPLLMTFGEQRAGGKTAAEIVNSASEAELADVLFRFGGERAARRIAKAIGVARRTERILTSARLAEIIADAAPRRGKLHPATKTFQALRIAVNDELTAISEGLGAALRLLKPGGRIAVISFHSLEDRLVKNFLRGRVREGHGRLVNAKPVVPSLQERRDNPRSRSAKLRIFESVRTQPLASNNS